MYNTQRTINIDTHRLTSLGARPAPRSTSERAANSSPLTRSNACCLRARASYTSCIIRESIHENNARRLSAAHTFLLGVARHDESSIHPSVFELCVFHKRWPIMQR
jgi:hypothetical protein